MQASTTASILKMGEGRRETFITLTLPQSLRARKA
jgi:hypothetical protein